MIKVDQPAGTLSKSIHSGKWMTLSMVTQKILSVGTFFTLARLLTPADYGVIAIALIITATIDKFTSPGLETALVQKRTDMEPYLDAIWTANVFRSFLLGLIIFWAAGPLSDFFDMPEAIDVIRLSSLLVILPKLGNTRLIYFFTELNFKKIFWRDLSGQIAYTIIAIAWALFISASFWALFLGHISRLLISSLISYILYPSPPRFSFNFKPLLPLVNYSKWIMGQNILDYFIGLLDQIFVGKLLGVERLGFYSKARDLSFMTTSSLLSIIRKVSFYAYVNIQTELKKIQDGFIKSLDLVLIVTLPFCFLLLVEGGAIISVLLGPNWLGLVVPLKILAVANIFKALASPVYPIFNSMGRPEINFKINIIRLIFSIPLFYWGIKFWGTDGAAWAFSLIALIVLLYSVWQARGVLKLNWGNIMPSILHISFSLAPVVLLAVGLRPFIHSFNDNYLISAWVILLSFIYAGFVWFFGRFFPGGPSSTLAAILLELRAKERH